MVLWDPKKQTESQRDFLRLMMLLSGLVITYIILHDVIHLPKVLLRLHTGTLAFHPSRIFTWLNFSDTVSCQEARKLDGRATPPWYEQLNKAETRQEACLHPLSKLALSVIGRDSARGNWRTIYQCSMLSEFCPWQSQDASGTLIKQSLKFKVETCVSYTYLIRILPDRLCRKYGGKKKVMWLLRHTKLTTCICC